MMEKPIGAMALLAGIVLAISQVSVADDFDGSELLLCATGQAQTCTRDGKCVFSSPEAVNVPAFVEIEFEQGQIRNTTDVAGERKSTIDHKKITDNEIILYGYQGYAWSMVISRSNGRMTLTVSNEDEGFVVFGACTAI
jgi:hypothetical protein